MLFTAIHNITTNRTQDNFEAVNCVEAVAMVKAKFPNEKGLILRGLYQYTVDMDAPNTTDAWIHVGSQAKSRLA